MTDFLNVRAMLIAALLTGLASAQQNHKTWMDYGGGLDSSHYVALTQINKSNVNELKIAWTYSTSDNRAYLFNPIVVDNVMYVLSRNSSLVRSTQRKAMRSGSTRISPVSPRAASPIGKAKTAAIAA